MGELLGTLLGGGGGGDDGGGGILSTILGVAGQAVGIVPVVGPLAAGVIGGVGGAVEGVVGGVLDPLGLGGIVGGTGLAAGGPVDTTGFSGGNGRFVTRTTVETMDTQTGTIVKVNRTPGQPFMMNRDVSAMKKVLRQIGALNKRVPRKTRKPSRTEDLKDAAIDAAIRQAQITGGDCK